MAMERVVWMGHGDAFAKGSNYNLLPLRLDREAHQRTGGPYLFFPSTFVTSIDWHTII